MPKKELDLNEIPHLGLREFFRKGLEMKGTWYSVKPGTDEFNAWADYFDRVVGARPLTMKAAAAQPNHPPITMPTQWPQWFDSSYAK